jgi:hypothetical protein
MAMIPDRYPALLNRLLDDELTGEEGEELAGILKENPECLQDLQRHLFLWEIWSQYTCRERSAQAFLQSWKTRLVAEQDGERFVEDVHRRLYSFGILSHPIFAWLYARRSWVVVSVCLMIVISIVMFRFGSEDITTVHGEGVCSHCILHEGERHNPAMRVHDAEGTKIIYLDMSLLPEKNRRGFCGKPEPIVVRGALRKNKERFTLVVQSLEKEKSVHSTN